MPTLKHFLTLLIILTMPSYAQTACAGQDIAAETENSNTEEIFKIKISAGELDRQNELVDAPILIDGVENMAVVLTDGKGREFAGQLTGAYYADLHKTAMAVSSETPNEASKLKAPARLKFVLDTLPAGESITLTAKKADPKLAHSKYVWHDDKLTQAELQFDSAPVIKFMYETVDDGSPERRAETYKVFHHVYSPAGDRLLTKGAGGLFPHHRGIFFGFNRISYGDGKKADVWHCTNGASQVCQSVVNLASPLTGRTRSTIVWNGEGGTPFAMENRELTAHKANGATVIDFRSVLTSLVGELKLAGDPQHAGVQFRASQEVPDHTKQLTYYLRPDGKAKPGEFRNWSNKKNETEINKGHINLPWHALCMALPENPAESDAVKRYTICYLDSAANPKPARFSERDYGRFGSYFETTVDEENPLYVHYRYWIVDGEMTVEQVQSLSDQFANPVAVELVE